MRKRDYHRRNYNERGNATESSGNTPNNNGNNQGSTQRTKREQSSNRSREQYSGRNREQSSGRNREQFPYRDRSNTLGRSGSSRQNYQQNNFGTTRNTFKYKAEETVDDIREDIARLEKEIHMEIKEIRSMKL